MMMVVKAAAVTRTKDNITIVSLLVMLTLLRSSSSALRPSRRRAFAVTQQHFFWSNLRGGRRATEQDQASVDLSIGRKPHDMPLLYPVSVCSVRGLRDHMEDDFFVASDFCAVFDGHGGEAVAKYLRQNLYASLQASLPSTTKTSSGGSLDPKFLTSLTNNSKKTNETSAAAASATAPMPTPPLAIKDYEKALVRALNKVDREIIRISHWSFQGSTAVACWILPMDVVVDDADDDDDNTADEEEELSAFDNAAPPDSLTPMGNTALESIPAIDSQLRQQERRQQRPLTQHRTHTLLTANIGDSRAVLSRNKTAIIELTRDHKPNDPLEQQRIERVGGTIVWHGNIDRHGNPILGTGVWRVNGNLALARAIGDRAERPAVTSEPELSVIQLTREDDFVIIGTDGLWDVMSSCDCVAFVHALIEEAQDMGPVDYDAIAYMLVEEALRRGSYDNITVVLIWLHDQGTASTADGESTPCTLP